MSPDFIFALYVFYSCWHSGQNSRLYRILSRLSGPRYRVVMTDDAFNRISGDLDDPNNEWETSRTYYQELVAKYSGDMRR